MQLYRDAGTLVLGSRLKRFGDRFLSELSRIYKDQELEFEPSWFPVFYLIDREGKVTISHLAEELKITQSGATQLIKSLEHRKLLEEVQEEGQDKRTKSVNFSPRGREILESVKPVWNALSLVMDEILSSGARAGFLIPALEELENNLEENSLSERVIRKVQQQELMIRLDLCPWEEENNPAFQKIMLEFLTQNEFMDSPVPQILKTPGKTGGQETLFLLCHESRGILGFAVFIHHEQTILKRIYIAEEYQKIGIEEIYLDLLEAVVPLDSPLELVINRSQNALLKEINNRNYSIVKWDGNDLHLRRSR